MPPRQRLAAVREVRERGAIKFLFERDGVEREGFVASCAGEIVAYENSCRHVPVTLDYGDGRFLTADGQHFICRTHGAIYEPLTGLCVAGPCTGASLRSLPIEIEEGDVWLKNAASSE